MSGGSLDYLYSRVDEAAGRLSPSTPLRRAFSKHLRLVAKALREVEWADSSDTAPDNETERATIMACLHPGEPLATLIEEAEEVRQALHAEITTARIAARGKHEG